MRRAYVFVVMTFLGVAVLGTIFCFCSSPQDMIVSETKHTSASLNWWAWTPGDSVDDSAQSLFTSGYRPDQPIAFDHSLHAGDLDISCDFCHSSARRSPSASIPSVNTCMGCHQHAQVSSPQIDILKKHYSTNTPIEWVRVHDLPDFVRFSHEVHVNVKDKAGNPMLACETCHGNMKAMTIAEQWAPLQMGWCVECHNQIREPASEGKPAVTNASVSCNTCHY